MLCLLSGCDPYKLLGLDSYKSLGTFDTKREAQNQALAHIINRFDRLPKNDFYRVSYSFRDVDPSLGNRHAIWYNQQEHRLGMEVDLGSGMTCIWYEVDQALLEQIVQINQGMAGVDSLAKSVYDNAHCLQ